MALFSTNLPHQQSANLVEFRAGKMQMRAGNMVHPDSRKGLVYVYQSDDGLMHFCWKDRTSGAVEDDLIIFPDDVEFTRVNQCTTGRVYLLRFKNSQKKMFFWMQAFKDEKDEENCRKVNEYLNNPPVPGAGGHLPGSRGAAVGGSGSDNLNDQFAAVSQLLNLDGAGSGTGEDRMDLNNALQGMDQQQLMQLLQLVGGSSGSLSSLGLDPTAFTQGQATTTQRLPVTTAVTSSISSLSGTTTSVAGSGGLAATAPTNTTTSAANKPQQNIIQTSDLRNILQNMGVTAGGNPENSVDLTNVLNAKNIAPVLSAGGTEGAAERLLSHLPSEPPATQDNAELLNTLHSSQFKQAVGMFGDALQSGQMGPCMRQFGFPDNVIKAVQRGDVQSVAEVLEQEAAKRRAQESTGSPAAAATSGNDQKKSDDDKNPPSGAGGSSDDKKKKDNDDAMDLD